MQKFRYLPHTADMRFRAYGSSPKAAFDNAALALLNIMLDIGKIRSKAKETMTVRISQRAKTEEDLVWFTLQDILSKVDAKKLNAYEFKTKSIRKSRGAIVLEGTLACSRSREDNALLSVKAVTPHELRIRRKAGLTVIDVTVDV